MSEAPVEESREITVYQDFLAPAGMIKDLRPLPVRTTVPKGESVRESATSSMSPQSTVQKPSEEPVPEPVETENPSSNTPAEPITTTPIPEPDASSPASFEPTSPGWNLPPVPVAPPTSDPTQTP